MISLKKEAEHPDFRDAPLPELFFTCYLFAGAAGADCWAG
jgi:hypothetical protein